MSEVSREGPGLHNYDVWWFYGMLHFYGCNCCVDICVHVRFIFHALVCEVMRDVLPSLPLKCDIMFMITCMFISACMFIITSCPHLNCHFLMNKLSLPMAVDYGWKPINNRMFNDVYHLSGAGFRNHRMKYPPSHGIVWKSPTETMVVAEFPKVSTLRCPTSGPSS